MIAKTFPKNSQSLMNSQSGKKILLLDLKKNGRKMKKTSIIDSPKYCRKITKETIYKAKLKNSAMIIKRCQVLQTITIKIQFFPTNFKILKKLTESLKRP